MAIDNIRNKKTMQVLKKTCDLIHKSGVENYFVVGSIAVSGHLGKVYKTFSDIEIVIKPNDLKKTTAILSESDGYSLLEDLSDRNAFNTLDDVWIGFIDRSKKFEAFGLDPQGAYMKSRKGNLYSVEFDVLNLQYLTALYEMAVSENDSKKSDYQNSLKLLKKLI